MIHAIDPLDRLLKDSPEAACEALIQMARSIHDEDGIQVSLVFDGREKQLQIEHPCKRATFSVLYSPRQLSADGVIEQMLARSKKPDEITVASRDNMIREAAAARGAFSIDGPGLESWVARCEQRTTSRIQGPQKKPWRNTFGDNLHFPANEKRRGGDQ